MENNFESELQGILFKYKWSDKCDAPCFVLTYQILRLLDTIRVSNELTKQWNGE